MDRHVWWFRRTIVRSAMVSTFIAFVVGVIGAATVLFVLDGGFDLELTLDVVGPAVLDVLPLALVLGQAFAVSRLALGFVANPLTWTFLRRYVADQPQFEPGPVPGEPDPVGEFLVSNGLVPMVTVSDVASGRATVFDLYQSSEGLVTAAVSRQTGSVSLISGLSDGRVAHTATAQVLPHEELVVNTVPKADAAGLIESHQALLGVLALRDIRPVASTARVWLHVARCEHAGYTDLGPAVGSLCNLTGSRGLGRLLIRVPAEAVLDLAVPATAAGRFVPGTSRLAQAFGAAVPA